MSRLTTFHRVFSGAAIALALSACTPAEVKPTEKMPLDKVMTQAADASKAGEKEKALDLLNKAAVDYPGDKSPWLQKAQIKFDGGQYGEAVLAAQQALARDPTDNVANSIVAISGLRLSTAALADMIRQNNLSGSLRSESQELAKLLRESLNEKDLSTGGPKPKAVSAAPQPVRTVRKAPAVKETSDSASPFGDLK